MEDIKGLVFLILACCLFGAERSEITESVGTIISLFRLSSNASEESSLTHIKSNILNYLTRGSDVMTFLVCVC